MIEYFNQVFFYIIKYATLNNKYKTLVRIFEELNKEYYKIDPVSGMDRILCKKYKNLFKNYKILKKNYESLNKQYKIYIEDYKNLLKRHELFFQENIFFYEIYDFLFIKLNWLDEEYIDINSDYYLLDCSYDSIKRNKDILKDLYTKY